MLQTLYNTLFFKVLYIFVKIVQHKQETRKDNFFQNTKKKKKNKQNVTQRSELQKLYTTCKQKIKTRLELL